MPLGVSAGALIIASVALFAFTATIGLFTVWAVLTALCGIHDAIREGRTHDAARWGRGTALFAGATGAGTGATSRSGLDVGCQAVMSCTSFLTRLGDLHVPVTWWPRSSNQFSIASLPQPLSKRHSTRAR